MFSDTEDTAVEMSTPLHVIVVAPCQHVYTQVLLYADFFETIAYIAYN